MGCADTCCASEAPVLKQQAEGESSSKSDTPLLTAQGDAPLGSTLGEGWVSCVSEGAGLGGAPSTRDAERGEPVEINVIRTVDSAGASRSVRWGKEVQKPQEINGDGGEQFTGPVAIRFNISNVQGPLAAASKVAGNGNRIVLEGSGGYIESIATGDRIALRLEGGVYVFDVVLSNGEKTVIALDSGAGVCVWPESWKVDAVLEKRVRASR